MTVQKIKSGRVPGVAADDFVGELGTLFFNEDQGDLRVSDGQTLGGIPIAVGGSGGGSYTLPKATTTRLGGVKVDGTTITIDNGVITAQASLLQGPQGERGLTGATGPQGIQGIQGLKGDTGATGPQGLTGDTGAKGDTGAAGADGLSAYQIALNNGFVGTESQWLTSLKGESGTGGNGTNVTESDTAPSTPSLGDLWWDTISGNLFIYYDNSWVPAISTTVGASGPAGADGAQGPKGDTGDVGPAGSGGTSVTESASPPAAPSSGDLWWDTVSGNLFIYYDNSWVPAVSTNIGATGAQGPKGDKGDTGDASTVPGPQGLKGDKGDKGDTGDVGPQGLKGDTGDVGPQGLKGDTGDVGPKGDTGDIGPKGDTGDVGPKGDTGDVGPQGLKGDTGDVGPQGIPGPVVAATASTLGGVIIGSGIDVALDGTISVSFSQTAATTYINQAVSNLVDSAPETLNTLRELALSLNNDSNLANTLITEINKKANSADLLLTISGDDSTERKLNIGEGIRLQGSGNITITTDLEGKITINGAAPDLSSYALKTEIPTNNNQLSNGSGYITSALNTNGTFTMPILTAEPINLAAGQIALANGTSWDPLGKNDGKAYMAIYTGSGWIDIGGLTRTDVYAQILELG